MEIFGAQPSEPLKACVSEVDECDLFVGIYAHRYGHVSPDSQRSITEQEFRRALRQRKPLFCYLIDDRYDWPTHFIEPEPGASKLLAFKRAVRKSLVVDSFSEPLDLAVKVATAVGRHLLRNQLLLAVKARDIQEFKQRRDIIALLEVGKHKILEQFRGDAASQEHFLLLHARNIEAIRAGELLLSHLLTADIHSLIYSVLESKRRMPESAQGAEEGDFQRREEDLCLDKMPDAGYDLRDFPDYPRTINVAPWYPYDTKPPEQHWHNVWSNSSGWYSRPRAPRGAAADGESIKSNSWRSHLLSDWLTLELESLQAALAEQRRIAAEHKRIVALERDADTRAVLKAWVRSNGSVTCPYCNARFGTSVKAGGRERCSQCRRHLELIKFGESADSVESIPPEEFQGHHILHGTCIKCGGTWGAIASFGFKCI
jgi:hypothetical protein